MQIVHAENQSDWESFLTSQYWSPFLQSWTMGEVYREIGQEPIRLSIEDNGEIMGICQALIVPAKRGKHIAVLYGPVMEWKIDPSTSSGGKLRMGMELLLEELKAIAKEQECSFLRLSPFWRKNNVERLDTAQGVIPSRPELVEGRIEGEIGPTRHDTLLEQLGFRPSPLHMLAEHVWYIDLKGKTPARAGTDGEEEILMGMRKTTRNLVRRAEREGVVVEASDDPVRDLPIFLELHSETCKRHNFTPYPDSFITAQVKRFSEKDQCRLYMAHYNDEVIAASVHMVYGGETSYHHGASSTKYPKIPASYLLQWTAIKEAIARGDRVYNFWGISPEGAKKHPFAGVRTFKTGFGGELLELMHCSDLPLTPKYWMTYGIEMVRKWRRGF